jgi:hypothetical protein
MPKTPSNREELIKALSQGLSRDEISVFLLLIEDMGLTIAPKNQPAKMQIEALSARAENAESVLRDLLDMEETRIANGTFNPNAEAQRRIDAARAILSATAQKTKTIGEALLNAGFEALDDV